MEGFNWDMAFLSWLVVFNLAALKEKNGRALISLAIVDAIVITAVNIT